MARNLDKLASAYLNLASFTLLFYDFFLTLDLEISRYRGRPLKVGTVLFFVNRYGTLFGNIPVVVQNLWTIHNDPIKITDPRCQHLETYHEYFIVTSQLLIGLILLLRTYVLYQRSKRVLAFMILVGVAAIGWSVTNEQSDDHNDNVRQCFEVSFGITAARGASLASAWAGSGTFDLITFLPTLYKGLSSSRVSGINFLGVLLRDGSIYFGITTLCNLWNILSFVLDTRGFATTFTNIISSVMLSRLMLNLRDPALLHIIAEVPTDVVIIPQQVACGNTDTT
ncbi:hypothetical protein C8R45DRAFT_1077458 [Mycena sanguinolenta]|nr:hypothetical protein C8R45DRAFT_1077458 [Mycena sanguinolenta]